MTKKRSGRKYTFAEIAGIVLLILLIASALFSLARLIAAPAEQPENEPYVKLKSDYMLMLLQCILGLVVMFLPTIVTRKLKIVVPDTICIMYYFFLDCAIILGEIFDFYYLVPHWDTMLHAFSGAMLGALGFILVEILNQEKMVRGVSLSPFFVSLFAFCFALSVGALWEIYEFSFDYMLGLNMQKHTTADGVQLVGVEALSDTMKDIIIDAAAALITSIIGGVLSQRRIMIDKSSKQNEQTECREQIAVKENGEREVKNEENEALVNECCHTK